MVNLFYFYFFKLIMIGTFCSKISKQIKIKRERERQRERERELELENFILQGL